MSDPASPSAPPSPQSAVEATGQASLDPVVVAGWLALVASHDLERDLGDLQRLVDKIRASTTRVADARTQLRATPAAVLHQALQLRAAQARPLP